MKTIASISVTAILLLGCAACTSQASTPTMTQPSTPILTFEDDRCQYNGPDSIPADKFAFQWVMNGQKYEDSSVFAVQVEEGHSFDDLIGTVLKAPTPSWINSVGYQRKVLHGPWTQDVSLNLSIHGEFKPGQVYFLCAHVGSGDPTIFGVAGPVEAKK